MHVIKHAVILFLDCRGFTSWSNNLDAFEYLEEFLASIYASIITTFAGAFVKTLGDGAMIIQECPIPESQGEVTMLLTDVLLKICQVETAFRAACDLFAIRHGHTTALRLGWGMVRGIVNVLSREDLGVIDYIGTNCNKASRLCYLARPAGIVIDREDFPLVPELPEGAWPEAYTVVQRTFMPEEHHVNGIVEPLGTWSLLTMEGSIMAPERQE